MFLASIETWWPTYVLPKSVIVGSRGLFQNMIVGIQKLSTRHLLPRLMMSQGRFPSPTLSSIKVQKSSLMRALVCNQDFLLEPLLCPNSSSIPIPEIDWLSSIFHSAPSHYSSRPSWSERVCGCVCRVRSNTRTPVLELRLPPDRYNDVALETEGRMGRISSV